ncbi:MAG: NfeD family protein [Cyanobacteria bacterium P01_A01_bin.105]
MSILVWIVLGAVLCVMEMVLPSAFLESALGISALLTGLLSFWVPNFGHQVALWMGLSLLMFWALKRLVPNNTAPTLRESTSARTLTAIPQGQPGRVIYEGSSWQARCSDEGMVIAPDQAVLVIGRQGNTLIVLPETTLLE